MKPVLTYIGRPWRFILGLLWLMSANTALADTPLALKQSWAGNINYVGTQKTLRTSPNTGNPCAWVGTPGTTSAAIAGIPASATIQTAYLYWVGSGATPDYTVRFEGTDYTATSQYTSNSVGYRFFSGVVDVTSKVVSKRNGTYSLTNLTIDNTNNQDNYCSVEVVLGGWALVVVYADTSEPMRVINLYEGFQYFNDSSISLTLSNFKTPTPLGAATGKASHISWEGDPTLSGGGEDLKFQGIALNDGNNPSGNQFNSVSSITAVSPSAGAVDTAAYGVDFDAYVLTSTHLTAGMTSASTVYSTGGDLVLLSAEVIAVPNVPVADLGITMGFSGTMGGGQTVTYTLDVTNNGPNTETGPITVTNTPSAALTYTGASGTGWTCPSPYTTCTRTGTLASGASANSITLTAIVSSSATGNIANTATVAGALFDNISSNNTATDTRAALAADLAMSMSGGSLTPGSNSTYTLTVTNNGPNTHTGTISVSDVLPSGLTYVSAVGSGWSCSTGVSCTYSGSLASGDSAPITLTVAVAAGAAGPITNSATVTGAYYDSSTANNTASLTWGSVTTGGCTTGAVAGDVLITCTSDGTVTIPSGVTNVRYLVVGGGGAGGAASTQRGGGSGGGGGVRAGTTLAVTPGATQTVTVGSGGQGDANAGNKGSDSSFGSLVTAEGGGGGGYDNGAGVDGGSGGGGGGNQGGGNGTSGQGNDGGNGSGNGANSRAGGGGGGAAEVGSNGSGRNGGDGGDGIANDITGTSTYYGGGGGGGANDNGGNGNGGAGGNGGGASAPNNGADGNPGSANTGGGGSGATTNGTARSGGSGGSGIVILRYTAPGPQVCEGFESGLAGWTIDNTGGTNPYYGTAVIDTTRAQSGSKSLRMSRDWVKATFNSTINTTGTTGSITFGYGRGLNGSDYPEPGDNMLVEYLNSSNAWTTLTTINGANSSDTSWQTATVALPANAKHSGFKIRFTQILGSGNATNDYDQWNLDSVCVPGGASSVHHYELAMPADSVACATSTVTVNACADNSSPCTSKVTTINGSTATLTASAGSLANTTVTFDATGTATTTLSHAAAGDEASVTVTLAGESTTATNPRQCCPDGANCVEANACSTTFKTAGFIFSTEANGSVVATIGNQIAGTRSATDYYLRAVKSSSTTKACEAALTDSTAVNLGYSCNNPASCTSGNHMKITPYDGATEKATVGVPAGGGSVTLYFDANGNAPLKFNYFDVGSIALSASKVAGGTLLSSLSGTSNNFVVRPYTLVLSGIKCTTASADYCGAGALALGPPKTPGDNPGATTAAGSPTFIRAGHPFSVTVTAQAEGGSATPNFGNETVPEWVKLTPALLTGLGLTANPSIDRATTGGINAGSSTLTVADSVGYATDDRIRVAGAGTAGADLVTTVAAVPSATSITLSAPAATTVAGAEVNYMFPAFSGGSATGSNFTWDEVGILTLTPAIGDGNYLGAGSVTGTASSSVGRFYPHHFSVDAALVTRSDLLSKFASTTGAIDAGTSALTVASATGINIGRALRVAGAGSAGDPLGAIVTNVAGNVLTLSIAANSTVSGTAVHNLTDVSGTAAAFTYMNEPLLARTTVTARSANEKTTVNYASANSFAKLDAASLTSSTWLATGTTSCPVNTQCFGFGAIDAAGPTALTGRLSVDSRVSSPASYWSGGIGYFATHLQLARPATTASDATWGPYNALSLGVAPWDTDGVTLPNASSSDTAHRVNLDADNSGTNERWRINTVASSIRFGRLRLINFYGSELLPARVEYRAESWDGNRWAINALDSTTALVAGNIATGGLTVGTVGALANGVGFITFATAGVDSYDIAFNLGATANDTSCNTAHPATTGANLPWLQGHWSGSCGPTPAWAQDPNARIRLGSPKAPYIYLRERY